MKKIIAFSVCLALLFITFSIVVVADNNTTPYANNVNVCNANLEINQYGHAIVAVGYYGYQGITSGATITVQMQKKFLGLFWRDVDGKYWEYSSNEVSFEVSNTVQLSDKGTYRIVVNFSIYGSGGTTDNIEKIVEAKW